MAKKRSSFSGKLGFVLATAGSAVGLGNIWRFPYITAKYGGAVFLIVYVIFAVIIGLPLMSTEMAIGRMTGKSAIEAYGTLDKKSKFIGVLGSIVPFIIVPYYCVIGGWVMKYMYAFSTGDAANTAIDGYFDNFVKSPAEPLIFFCIFLGLTALVVMFGVEKGIENISKVLMPILVIQTIAIAIYVVCLPGSSEGIAYYLKPDLENFSFDTVINALGQMFYSMSIAMGILITYGSYMKKDISIENSCIQVQIFDTGIALFAGLMIIPSVLTFSGGDKSALSEGPGLMFETLPKVFMSMNFGAVIGIVFFVLVFFAALTSSISLFETIVSIVMDRFGLSRKKCCVICLIFCIILGSLASLGNGVLSNVTIFGMDILTFCDTISNNVLMPIVAICSSVFVGWFLKPQAIVNEIETAGNKFRIKKLYVFVIKYIAPVAMTAILVSSLLSLFGVI